MHRSFAVVAVCFALNAVPVLSQLPEHSPAGPPAPLTWDVVSIKPHRALDNSAMTRILPDGFEMQNMPETRARLERLAGELGLLKFAPMPAGDLRMF